MSAEMYEILSLLMRYFFAGLMLLIVYRGWRITVRDNRRAKVLRDWSPETGCVGQLIVGPGLKSPELVPVPREGVLGSSRKADIPIRSKEVLPEHAHIESREGGLLIRPLGRAQVALGKGDVVGEQLFAQDGDVLTIGKLKLLVVLFDPGAKPIAQPKPAPPAPAQKASPPPAKRPGPRVDWPPAEQPKPKPRAVLPKPKQAKQPAPKDPIDFFDEEALWRDDPKKSTRRS